MPEATSRPKPPIVQLLTFTDCADLGPLLMPLKHLTLDYVVYKDVNDPQGFGLLTIAEDPDALAYELRDLLASRMFRVLMQRHALTMIGRSVAVGAPDLSAMVADDDWPWAVWHPIRATPALLMLDAASRHGVLGSLLVGEKSSPDRGHVLLHSHGLEREGNDFVHGILGADLGEVAARLSAMKRAPEYAEYFASTGPFFVGRAHRDSESRGPQARW